MPARLLSLLLIASGVDAGTPASLPSPLALDCLACHRPGRASAELPSLAGRSAAAIEAALKAARDQPRPGALMPRLVAKLDDATLARVAAEVAALSSP